MAMKFTPDQQRVIDLRNCNILVSAAAGSGKTAVLVERITELVSAPENRTDIDKLLVVTFTNAAAAQMRERLAKALSERAELDPENQHLQRQLTLIHNAQITTIDSFCMYLIRNHFNDIGLDPDFRTADEGEMKLLFQDVLKQLLEEKFEQKDPDFLHCVECFVPGGRESRLEELILQIHAFSMSYPWPKEWLNRHRADYDIASVEELEQTEWFEGMKETVAGVLCECGQQLRKTLQLCAQPDGPYMYAAALEADLELTEQLEKAAGQAQDGWAETLYARLSALSFPKLGVKKDPSVSAEKREQAKKERERVKTMLTALKEKYFYAPPQKWVEEMQKAAPALHALVDLALLFQEKLAEKKREKNLLDFSDMEHMALQILLNFDEDGNPVPSKTALEYREQFGEILIDEYQDSNLVQELLLQSISGEDDKKFNRFMVGDVKQSIYKFRLARPELFMEKFDCYEKEDGDCVRVDLKQNFRSRREVTDCVNDVFLQVMHKGLGGVEYDSDAALYPAAEFPQQEKAGEEMRTSGEAAGEAPQPENADVSPYEPEFLIALEDGRESGKELEARMIADRIRSLVGTLQVRDPETKEMRPASYRDIVILLRTTSGWDETFKKILEEAGIPVHVTSRTGYFAATEVQNVLNFLRVLNNPLQDIPLFGVLHSGIGDFSDEEIAALRAMDENGKRKLYDCMKLAAQKEENAETEENAQTEVKAQKEEKAPGAKCRVFLDFLQRFREYAVYLPIHDLIGRFLEETGYLYTVSALPGGGQRRANVEMLLARAESFEKTSYSGLFHFIRYIEQMEKYDVDYGESGTMDENADVVRIMSIHKSKGLEFPICFVSGLSKRFNRQDTVQPVIMDMDMGLALDCVDPVARTKRTTLKKNVLARKLLADSMGEELRVLYVAMTRAEEKLILTASCKTEKAPEQEKLPDSAELPAVSPVRLMEASCFYDILLPAWQTAKRQVRCVGVEDFAAQELTQLAAQGNLRQRLEVSDPAEYLDTDACRALLGRIQSSYAHENLAELFVKTTVSELKKAGMQETEENSAHLFEEEEIIPYLPRFVQKEEGNVTGTTRGSAYHRLLELFPIEKKENTADWTAEEVRDIIAKKRESKELTEEYAAVINPHKIAVFLRSALAGRMRRAQLGGRLRREQPFVLGIPASQLKPSLPKEETVLIQGIIDVFFEEDGALVVADYKTDAVKEAQELVRRYQVQLDYYAQALERLTGKDVKEKIIYSFALEQEIVL
ncbi:MAG: helicase-exonuclease AddAB subunit AddA [Eubacteriales bacterium]|nr:helicase-exonuclease AddAB subunit AddA [Eubacteriales bacterium]